MTIFKSWMIAAVMLASAGAVSAEPVFQGRLADGTASTTCTVSGTTKCAMFYDTTLDITILNDWSIGYGQWSETAAAGSAQALAESAGATQTDFTGWYLPTGDGRQPAGPLNQYLSILDDVGGSLAGLQAQFDGVQDRIYWSSTFYRVRTEPEAWVFFPRLGSSGQAGFQTGEFLLTVAVRPGDVTAAVPEPQTLALAMLALGATMLARRRRSR